MGNETVHSISAVACLIPAAVVSFRRPGARDWAFWATLALAFAGATGQSVLLLGGGWSTAFAPALWVSIATVLAMFAIGSATMRDCWRLCPLLAPYLLLVGLVAATWRHAEGVALAAPGGALDLWLSAHIVIGVATYGFLTFSAVAALAAFLQERALKRKRPTRLTQNLPSVSDSERLSTLMLVGSEAVLGLGVLTGMEVDWLNIGALIHWDYKTTLSLSAFFVIGGLLLAKAFTGMRGRMVARLVLLAYLLLTLAYPGVKFIANVALV